MIKTYIVNLKKDIEKKEHMQNLCQKYGLDVEFIEAVDGKALNEEDITKVYSSKKAIDKIGRELSRGEIGCALSHKMIYQRMVDENISEAIILEDDIDFDDIFLDLLNHMKQFPANAELVLLGYWYKGKEVKNVKRLISFHGRIKFFNSLKLVRFTKNIHGTYGYFITVSGAEKLLQCLNKKIEMSIDHYTGDERFVNLYGIFPAIVKLSDKFDMNTNLEIEREQKRAENKSGVIRFETTKYFLNQLRLLSLMRFLKDLVVTAKNSIIQLYYQMKKPREYN